MIYTLGEIYQLNALNEAKKTIFGVPPTDDFSGLLKTGREDLIKHGYVDMEKNEIIDEVVNDGLLLKEYADGKNYLIFGDLQLAIIKNKQYFVGIRKIEEKYEIFLMFKAEFIFNLITFVPFFDSLEESKETKEEKIAIQKLSAINDNASVRIEFYRNQKLIYSKYWIDFEDRVLVYDAKYRSGHLQSVVSLKRLLVSWLEENYE